jgi:hypothetical protein
MKKIVFDTAVFLTAIRTAGALIAGNGIVQLYMGAGWVVVAELLVTGLLVIVVTSFRK